MERVMRSTTSGMTSLERVPKQQPNLHSHQLQQPNLHSHRLLPACCSYPWTSWQQPIVSSVIMIVPRSAAGSGCKSRHCLQSHLTVAHTHTSSNPPRKPTQRFEMFEKLPLSCVCYPADSDDDAASYAVTDLASNITSSLSSTSTITALNSIFASAVNLKNATIVTDSVEVGSYEIEVVEYGLPGTIQVVERNITSP